MFQAQPAVEDNLSVAARTEFTVSTNVTDNREEEKAALKEERKANEGPANDIFEDVSTGFNVNSKPFVFKPANGQA